MQAAKPNTGAKQPQFFRPGTNLRPRLVGYSKPFSPPRRYNPCTSHRSARRYYRAHRASLGWVALVVATRRMMPRATITGAKRPQLFRPGTNLRPRLVGYSKPLTPPRRYSPCTSYRSARRYYCAHRASLGWVALAVVTRRMMPRATITGAKRPQLFRPGTNLRPRLVGYSKPNQGNKFSAVRSLASSVLLCTSHRSARRYYRAAAHVPLGFRPGTLGELRQNSPCVCRYNAPQACVFPQPRVTSFVPLGYGAGRCFNHRLELEQDMCYIPRV